MNAPRELATILSSWSALNDGQTVLVVHGGDQIDAWRLHVRAMELVGQVTKVLQAMEQPGRNVDHYRLTEVEWVKGVIQPDRVWNESSPYSMRIVEQSTIDQLMALADVVDSEGDRFRVSDLQRAKSLEALNDLFEVLGDPDALPLSELERRYAFELINGVRTLLDEATVFNGLDLSRRIHELVGYLNILADEADGRGMGSTAAKLRDLGRKVRPFVVNGSIVVAGAIDVVANLKELSS